MITISVQIVITAADLLPNLTEPRGSNRDKTTTMLHNHAAIEVNNKATNRGNATALHHPNEGDRIPQRLLLLLLLLLQQNQVIIITISKGETTNTGGTTRSRQESRLTKLKWPKHTCRRMVTTMLSTLPWPITMQDTHC